MNPRKYLIPGVVLGTSVVVLSALHYRTSPSFEPVPNPAGNSNDQPADEALSIAEIQARALAAVNRENPADPAIAQQQAKARIAATGIAATGGIVETRPQGPLLMVFNQIRSQWQPVQFRMVGEGNRIRLVLQTDDMFTPELVVRESYKSMLGSLPAMLKSSGCSQCRVQIEAHTDNRLEPPASLHLSQQMAETVVKLLAENGWQQERINAQGLGDTQPQSPNNHVLTRPNNRRIVLQITSP